MSRLKKLKKLVFKEDIPLQNKQQLVLENTLEINHSKTKKSAKEIFKTVKKVIIFGKPFHKYLWSALIFVFVSTFFDLLVPVYIGKCIDHIIGVGQVDFVGLRNSALLLIGFVLLSAIFNLLANTLTNKYTFLSAGYIREKIFSKFNRVPIKFIDQNSHGDLLSRMINDVELLTDGVLEGLSSITNGVVSILGTLVFMFALNVPLALVITILTPLSLLLSMYIAQKSYKYFAFQMKNQGEINGYLEELISGGRTVKAFNFEKQSQNNFEVINQKFYKVNEKADFVSNLANPSTRFINSIVYTVVGFVGAMLALKGVASNGLISSFLFYATSFGKPFNELSVEITELQAAFASAERIFSILEAENEESDSLLPDLMNVSGKISVKNAYFSYQPKVKLIENFNLEVKPGEKVAIVGPTGCGKSTFINLLMRFYNLTQGEIEIDDKPIKSITRSSMRRQYGMVLQDSWLFASSIKDNIAYGKPNATDDEVVEASKLAGAHEFIEKLPTGYNTIVSEGANNISQGQKQLICIARIMLTRPPMLILDEATSNIDTRTEIKIQEAFNTIMDGRTTFIVAHRLSTITSADIILVMNKGNIIEQGKHNELLEKGGFYYHLYNAQFAKSE
ncbi:MAG: ABC transporter ATP-binding protein [Clostridia bacterium]